MSAPFDLADAAIMPPSVPYYQLPATYRDVAFHVVRLSVDAAAVARLLPPPLVCSGGGVCTVTTVDVPYSSSYGPFQESFLQLDCTLEGAPASYMPFVFLNNVRAIVAGREVYGTPKIWADVSGEGDAGSSRWRTVLDGDLLVAQRVRMTTSIGAAELPSSGPAYRLKLVPAADGRGPAIKQLVSAGPERLVLRDLMAGDGSVDFGVAAGIDLRPLQPRQLLGAFRYTASYVEGWGRIAHDYLAHVAS
jgi:acetoacetate decarboxylase